MSKHTQIKLRVTQTQLDKLQLEALTRNMSVPSFVRHLIRIHQAEHPLPDGNPYLKGLERNGIVRPEDRCDER